MQRPRRALNNCTDAKRAELTKQYDQRLAERQARQQAMRTACQGKTHGKAVQVKRRQTNNSMANVSFTSSLNQPVSTFRNQGICIA